MCISAVLIGGASGGIAAANGTGIKTKVFQTSSAYDTGIAYDNVRLGWSITSDRRGVYQTAYRCVITDESNMTVWDSGWVQSSEQTGIVPGDLKPETVYTAKVNIKDENGNESGFGEPLVFETAPDHLEGVWIDTERLARYVFTLDQPIKNIKRARCYISSTGVIEIRLNGAKVGDLIWGPRKGVSDKITYYNTFDITSMLTEGDNCIGAYVSGSTYMGHDLRGMLRIKYKDGSVQTITTKDGWKTSSVSEIETENLSKGENINNTKKTPWDKADFKVDQSWKDVSESGFGSVGGELTIPDNSGFFTTYQSFSGNYTIDAVITVRKSLGTIVFGAKDGVSSPLMWQITANGLRLHRVGWTEIDTPSAKGLGLNKKVTMRIEILDGTVTTYINGNKVHTVSLPQSQTDGALGIRSALNEVASYDRITVTQNGSVVWEDDFDFVDTDKWNFPGEAPSVPSPAGTKVIKEIKPVSCKEITSGGKKAYILDFGVNMQGYVKMTVKGNKNDKYKIEYSELLDEKGDIWANTTAHKPVSVYTLSGENDVFEPRFFYTGFRYLRVTPPENTELDPEVFTACFTSDDVLQKGFFKSSNDRLDQVFEMYNVSQRSNMMGNYTDCPQREKNGWTGDAAVTKKSAAILLNDWTTAEAYLDAMLMGVKADGRPEIVVPRPSNTESGAQYDITWASAIFIFPYELYMQTGDRYYIEHSIDTLIKVFDYASTYEKDYLVTQNVYGDWVGIDNANGQVDSGYLSASCYYNCGMLLSKMLDISGRDHAEHDAHMKKVFDAIQKKYYINGYYAKKSQTCSSIALDFGLITDENKKKVLDNLIEICNKKGRVLGTGVLGTKSLYEALSAENEHKLLLDMTISKDKGSFGFMIDNGATSLWEYWDTAGNNFNSNAGDFLAYFDSQNHVMLGGGPACWMFEGLGGIRKTGAGYSEITYRPGLESGLSSVSTTIDAVVGKCVSDWKYEGGILTWKVDVPANTKATVIIPLPEAKSIRESDVNIFEKDGSGIKFEGRGENKEFIYTVGGGSYVFTASPAADPVIETDTESDTNTEKETDTPAVITEALTTNNEAERAAKVNPTVIAVIAAGALALIGVVTAIIIKIRKKIKCHTNINT